VLPRGRVPDDAPVVFFHPLRVVPLRLARIAATGIWTAGNATQRRKEREALEAVPVPSDVVS
jgi:hypothetical protein